MFGYDFSIVHYSTNIMKDIYVLSRNINSLVYQYLVTMSIVHYDDLKSRHFVYIYDVFHNCSNPHHVKYSTTL